MNISRIFSKLAVALAVLCLGGISAQSQNSYCVRAGATGSGNGSDWNNAYPALPATLQRGATYYIASGTYGSYRFDDPVSGTNVITIKKATAADHKTDTGWVSTYGEGQAVWNGPLDFDTDYWVFDGQTRNESDWFSAAGYGFSVFHNNADQQIRMGSLGKCISNVQLKNTHLQARDNSSLSTTVTGRRYGLDLYTWGGTGTSRNLVVHKCFFQYGNVPIFASGNTGMNGNDGMIVEYSAFDDTRSNAANHGEAMSCYYTVQRLIVRYNKFRGIAGTAIIAIGGGTSAVDGFEFYGNVVWNSDIGDGVVGFSEPARSIFTNAKIYNNTIADKASGFNSGVAIMAGSNNLVYNNFWVNCSSSFWQGPGTTCGYNAYSWNFSEANAQVNVPTSVFVNYAAKDFRLAAPTSVGSPLASPYNKDMLGNTRGADGVWDRGAFEYTGIADTTPPVISNPGASSVGSATAVIAWTTDEASTTGVEYGPTTAYGSTVSNPSLVLTHVITLVNLTPDTTYNYRVRSLDLAGNSTTSGNFTFRTGIADTTAPTVALTAPATGVTVSNTVNLTATASDNVGVAGVKFFVDGAEVFDDTTSPYAYSWDTTWTANGSYGVSAQARDAAGNLRWSSTNTLVVNNPVGALPVAAAYWSFNEATGTASTDSISGNVLSLRNGLTWTTAGKFGAALSLDGVNDRADAPNSSALNVTGNAISVAAWVKLESTANWQQILVKVKETGAFTAPFFAWHLFGGHVSTTQWTPMFQLVNASEVGVNVSSSVNVNYGEWVHLVGVYDGAMVRIYINGVERGSAAQTGNIISYVTPLYVGAHGQPAEFAKGAIDEVRIYSRALTATQVQGLYLFSPNAPNAPMPPTSLRVVQN